MKYLFYKFFLFNNFTNLIFESLLIFLWPHKEKRNKKSNKIYLYMRLIYPNERLNKNKKKSENFRRTFWEKHFAFYVIFIYIIFLVIVLYKTWVPACLKLESFCREEKYNGMNPILYRIFHATRFNTFVQSRKRLRCQHGYCYSHLVSLDYTNSNTSCDYVYIYIYAMYRVPTIEVRYEALCDEKNSKHLCRNSSTIKHRRSNYKSQINIATL